MNFLERKMIEIIQLNTALAALEKDYEKIDVQSSDEGEEEGDEEKDDEGGEEGQ